MRLKKLSGKPARIVGILGGSFDPPHRGHVHVTHEALKRFGLDEVWWLVSPGNPLKLHPPAPFAQRMAACRALVRHPRVRISEFELQAGTVFTADTLRALARRFPRHRFVWLMGADNLADFHHWQDWQWIMRNFAIGVIARPGKRIAARLSPAARRFGAARLRGRDALGLGHAQPPAWAFENVPMADISSTMLRSGGKWTSSR